VRVRTGPELRRATEPFTAENRLLSWAHLLATIALFAAASAAAWGAPRLYLRTAASLLCGLLLLRFFCLHHEYRHGAVFRGSKLGGGLLTAFALYLLVPPTEWKEMHDLHHAHNSVLHTPNLGSFPIMTKREFESASTVDRRVYLAVRHPLTIALGYATMFLLGLTVLSLRKDPRKHWDSGAALALHGAAGALIAAYGGWAAFALVFLVPHLISGGLATYLFYVQHNFPGVRYLDGEDWSFEGAAFDTSSYLRTGPLMSWFTANIGYHHVHHVNERIPFYRLAETMRAIPELGRPPSTSLNPLEVWRALSLKVWDEASGQLVPVPSGLS
jgi:omega-6 fatty acid desaturase (delta-12 desaturase)